MLNKIEVLLKKEILQYENEILNSRKQQSEHIHGVINKLKMVIEEPKKIVDIDIEQLKIPFISEFDIKRLNFYKKLCKTTYELNEQQKNDIIGIFNVAIDNLNQILAIVSYENDEVKAMKDKIAEYKTLISKLDSNVSEQLLDFEDISKIIDILDKNNLSMSEKVQAISDLTLCTIGKMKKGKIQDEEEIIEVMESDLSEEDVIKIFDKYSYDFDDLKEKDKSLILKYGNLDLMDSIFNTFEDNNIKIDISKYGGQMSVILLHSHPNLINSVIGNIKIDIEKAKSKSGKIYNVKEALLQLMKTPGVFIKNSRNYKTKDGKHVSGGSRNGGVEVPGAYNNYIKNRELFIELDVDIMRALDTCPSIFSCSNNRIKQNISDFEFYGIPKEIYTKSLTCLRATDALATIDQFIELNCYDYLLQNFSYVQRPHDDTIFYRIIKSRQLGETEDSIYRKYKNDNNEKLEFRGEISVESKKGYGINNSNKYKAVDQYFPRSFIKYDSVISSSDNNGPIISAKANYFVTALDGYIEDDLTYNFNGIRISRMKVLRYYETLIQNGIAGTVSSIKCAICKNSILTEEQFNEISKCVDLAYGDIRGVSRK